MKLILGDCLEKMKDIPDKSIDLILTDPPFGTTKCSWDIVIPSEPMWEQIKRVIKDNGAICLFGQEPFSSLLRISNINDYKYDWVWKKERLTNIFQVKRRPGKVVELISVFYKNQCVYNPQKTIHTGPKRTNKIKNGKLGKLVDNNESVPKEYSDDGTRNPIEILEFKRDILTSNLHPTQKPVALLEYLIKTYTNENEMVLDFTMGSGSTGIAAVNTNRNFIGIELSESYYNIAMNRINEHKEKHNV